MNLPAHTLCSLQKPGRKFFGRSVREAEQGGTTFNKGLHEVTTAVYFNSQHCPGSLAERSGPPK